MELELKKACFDAYEAAGELTLTQEETAETIVPDYCPDIARIIETTGKVFLHSREMRDGRAEISGTVRVTVLYTPEGEGGIRTLEFAMPFTVETDGRSLPDCAALLADTEPELLETRMLNPRISAVPYASARMQRRGRNCASKKSRSSSTPSC